MTNEHFAYLRAGVTVYDPIDGDEWMILSMIGDIKAICRKSGKFNTFRVGQENTFTRLTMELFFEIKQGDPNHERT